MTWRDDVPRKPKKLLLKGLQLRARDNQRPDPVTHTAVVNMNTATLHKNSRMERGQLRTRCQQLSFKLTVPIPVFITSPFRVFSASIPNPDVSARNSNAT